MTGEAESQVKKVAKTGFETGFFVQIFNSVKVTYQYVREKHEMYVNRLTYFFWNAIIKAQ